MEDDDVQNCKNNIIPVLELNLKDGGGEVWWKDMSFKVREACENHGCFLVRCVDDGFPSSLRQDMLAGMTMLFDLPYETKQKHVSPKPYRSYLGRNPLLPLSESFGIDDAPNLHASYSFTQLMWPQGNSTFCETIKAMSSKMQELNLAVLKMILHSYEMENVYEWYVKNMESSFRLMKYGVPPTKNDTVMGLVPHTDKNTLTTLMQNQVQGLHVMSKQGNWIQVTVPEDCFVVIVGDMLKAWSNGRIHAVKHRVILNGDEKSDRYSCGLFSIPKEDVVIEMPSELVDKDHPLMYRPFTYAQYMNYFTSNPTQEDALQLFAGLNC